MNVKKVSFSLERNYRVQLTIQNDSPKQRSGSLRCRNLIELYVVMKTAKLDDKHTNKCHCLR